ncbi:DEAD/DEAH box helicase family protein [Spirosoma aerophilum]
MINLFRFQINAADTLVNRFEEYNADPLTVKRDKNVPFYQILSSITGSGKTVILAYALETIHSRLPLAPIVLWISKGKVVVEQTLENLANGKYAPLVASYNVKPLLDCNVADIESTDKGLLLVATVGKFNQKDKGAGDRRVFSVDLDTAPTSLWEMLKSRKDPNGYRRPLIVIYDEGHNLSDQQSRLILDQEPDALIAASATARHPQELSKIIERLKTDKSWSDSDFVVSVKSGDVVEAGLVKQLLEIGGFTTPMEDAIGQLISDFKKVEKAAATLGISYQPKAIYVSKTNVFESGKLIQRDDIDRIFKERQARPILIWRYLVEQQGINPDEIAVYCDLKFDNKRFPPPDNFHLFSNGDSDYYRFTEGNFRHIIFNLSLQEGWDDPECGFAYIDKDMGSASQITQIVGRVLRQPGAQHYQDVSLNTAHFYVRTDEKGTFEEVLAEVQRKIASETPEVEIVVNRGSSSTSTKILEPVKKQKEVPIVNIRSSEALRAIQDIVSKMIDFRNGNETNIVGRGSRIRVLQTIGSDNEQRQEWVEVEHSNRVTARWIFTRELERTEPRAKDLVPLDDPKFDAKIEFNSNAAEQMRDTAHRVAQAYIEKSIIRVKTNDNPYEIQPIAVDPINNERFNNATHAAYSGMNGFEKEFAKGIDRSKPKRIWCRNPTGGYKIPLLSGDTRNFYPDFLVWSDKDIIAIDTKGDHLIQSEAGRKLLFIEKSDNVSILVRLVTQGEWNAQFQQKPASGGYTVWKLKEGKPYPIRCDSIQGVIDECLSV